MKIAVLVSGGVDSSVSLALLKEQGHDVTAFYLKIWLEDEMAYLGDCPWEEDLGFVEKVCADLNVPLKVISLQKEYWDKVVAYAIGEVKIGLTPNPDVMCNSRVKFGAFYDHIDSSYEMVASGHYASTRILEDGSTGLVCAPDLIKDQTYFLAHLTQDQLSRITFPIGSYEKIEVRELAEKYNLANKNRKDSQGICFLGKIKYSDFLKHNIGESPGDIVEFESGDVLGPHNGFWFHTIGQRFGLGLSGGPWYVVKKDVEENKIFVSRSFDKKSYLSDSFKVSAFNWISGKAPKSGKYEVKIRHGAVKYDCDLSFSDDCSFGVVKIDDCLSGIAAGQYAVFYDGDLCLGCGKMVD